MKSLENVLQELTNNAKKIDDKQVQGFIKKMLDAKHIYLTGAGRSGIVTRAFANRLMHLGFSVSVVGEISSPHSKPGDLVIICSGSGETGSLVSLAEKANKSGVDVALVTMKPESSIGKLAKVILEVPGTTKTENQRDENTFSQPMGSAFEQLVLLTYDSIVIELMEVKGETSETMFGRHADLE